MGFYARHVLPRLIDLAMGSAMVAADRAALIPLASGRVLEVGIGSGLNLPFYGPGVGRLLGVDPSPALWKLARHRAARVPFPLEFLEGSAEHLPARDAAFDTVVATWTLCSIGDPRAALAEIKRVLAPGGRFLFIEHGRSPDPRVYAWQRRLTPLWKRLAGGCRLDRSADELIRAAGLSIARIEAGYAEGPRLFTYRVKGVATRPA
jgi:ubiquinone/menaquinone biosynthesis C-methylase UbiE